MTPPRLDEELTQRLLRDVRAGNPRALESLLAGHRDYMRAVAELRLDRQVLARVDASDVVQEAMLEAARRIGDYLAREPMPFHLWLRATTVEHVIRLRRQHVEAECRSVGAGGTIRGTGDGTTWVGQPSGTTIPVRTTEAQRHREEVFRDLFSLFSVSLCLCGSNTLPSPGCSPSSPSHATAARTQRMAAREGRGSSLASFVITYPRRGYTIGMSA